MSVQGGTSAGRSRVDLLNLSSWTFRCAHQKGFFASRKTNQALLRVRPAPIGTGPATLHFNGPLQGTAPEANYHRYFVIMMKVIIKY